MKLYSVFLIQIGLFAHDSANVCVDNDAVDFTLVPGVLLRP